MSQWSEKLIELTKEELICGGHGIAVKNYNGQFGIISDNFNVVNRETNEKILYNSVDELINAGWAID